MDVEYSLSNTLILRGSLDRRSKAIQTRSQFPKLAGRARSHAPWHFFIDESSSRQTTSLLFSEYPGVCVCVKLGARLSYSTLLHFFVDHHFDHMLRCPLHLYNSAL